MNYTIKEVVMTNDGWQQFINLCRAAVELGNFDELMKVLLTAEEKEQLATRVLLLQQLLQADKSQT